MEFFFILLPIGISYLVGHLILDILWYKTTDCTPLSLRMPLAWGLGLGISSYLGFLSFLIVDGFQRIVILYLHALLIIGLIIIRAKLISRQKKSFIPRKKFFTAGNISICCILLCVIPLGIAASHYPWGGWDAWSCWNLKAKFLFLGENHWKNIFSPILWRASPHYPLLLPLTNIWTWIFLQTPSNLGPLTITVLFTLLTSCLLFAGLHYLTKSYSSILASLIITTLPFYVTLAISQYCDNVLAYFLLAALICFLIAVQKGSKSFLLLAGLFTGFMSFTKPEGTIAAILVVILGTIILFAEKKKNLHDGWKPICVFLGGAAIAFLPTMIFKFVYSPGNQTFVNGLFSQEKPVSLDRLKFVLIFFAAELTAKRWNWIWLVLLAGLVLSGKKCFQKGIRIVPGFLFSYLAIIIFYYCLNTYFEIRWWLQVTLNRILFSLLPTFLLWVFYSLWKDVSTPENKRLAEKEKS